MTGKFLNEKGNGQRAYLSLQFPGWPTPLWQRIMMLVLRESEAQKAMALGGQVKLLLAGLLLTVSQSSVSSISTVLRVCERTF